MIKMVREAKNSNMYNIRHADYWSSSFSPYFLFYFFCYKSTILGLKVATETKTKKILTYEAENCRPFNMQTLTASEGTSWNIKMRQRINNKSSAAKLFLFRLKKMNMMYIMPGPHPTKKKSFSMRVYAVISSIQILVCTMN